MLTMTHIIRLDLLFFMICFFDRTISQCRSSYPDLCGYNESEDDSKFEDENNLCDCQQVMFCSLIELSEECNTARVLLITDSNGTQLDCVVSTIDSLADTLPYKIVKKKENEFSVEVFTEFNFGKYKVTCDASEIPPEFITPNYTQWDIIGVTPMEVLVDSQVMLELTVTPQPDVNSAGGWCFLNTPDRNLEVLTASWISESQINCINFQPTVPGAFNISLSSSLTPNIFEKSAIVKVTSKHPIPEKAEYDSDFKKIFIHFDGNIELHSTCTKVFPKNFHKNFGLDFNCFIKGNIFVIKMGQQFKIINLITITGDNKICRAGSQPPEFCLSAEPLNLTISKPKVLDPDLSFYTNSPCEGNTTGKHVSVNVMPSRQSNFPSQNQTNQYKTSGKIQRKNLISWRLMREVQSRFSSRLVFQLNETDVQPLFNTLPSLVNAVDVDHLNSVAKVLVFVQTSPATLLAEANVTFCEGFVKLFRHKWVVNGRDVSEEGKLLVLRGLTPGKYVIECVVIANDTEEVLGQGWTTTEIIPGEEKVLVVPSETTVGVTDGVFLRAVTWHGNSVSWTCRMESDEVCFTRDKKLMSDVVDLNSPDILVPAGTLPVGVYIWTVENARGSNKARVVVKTGNSPSVRVESPVIVKASQEVVLRGILRRMRGECRAWWTSVREKGFSYFNAVNSRVDVSRLNTEIPLVIRSENWKPPEPDSLYLFQLHVFCPRNLNNENGSYDYVKVPLLVNDPPSISVLSVQPLTGAAMITNFEVSGVTEDSAFDNNPLMYEWSYVDSCDVEVLIRRGVSFVNFTTYLPPGDFKLMVKVCNGKNICSSTSTPFVSVVQESEFPEDNFRNALVVIKNLFTSGETLEGFGLATTVFKSLALLAETEIREGVHSTVENFIGKKIKILTRRVQSDPQNLDLCLEFFEQAATVAKYMRKGSPILNRLMEFRENVLKMKRGNGSFKTVD